jgi:hypothetical protein
VVTNVIEPRHSGLGISSFVLSVIIGVLMFCLFVIAGVIEQTTPGGMDEEAVSTMLVGLFLIGFMVLDVVAIGLGIAGLFQANRRKLFAILGVVFASITLLLTGLLMVIGLMA